MSKVFNSLRTKVLGALTLALLVLFLTQYAITRAVLLNGFSHLDTTRANLNLQLIRTAIEQQLSQLEGVTKDYAYWDEMIDFVKGSAPKLIDTNFSPQTFTNLKVNAILITDVNGKILFSKAMNWSNKMPLAQSRDLLSEASPNGRLQKHNTPNSEIIGLILLDGNPVLVASVPILNSNAEGDIYGTVIMTRNLDDTLIKAIYSSTKLTTTLKTIPNTDQQSPADKQLLDYLYNNPTYVETRDNNTVIASALFSDISNKPTLIYSVDSPREIYAQIVASTGYLFWSSFAIFAILGLISLLFDYLVIGRITKLTNQVHKVGTESSGIFSRLPISGPPDELANLTESMNNMLTRIEQGIAERKRAEDRIYLMAHYDQLTRLPNRVLFTKLIDQAITNAKANHSQFALLFMDLDRFKNVNDSIGHDAGDELLVIVADRLRSFIRGRAQISRLGGDEFVILLPDLIHTSQAEEFAARLVTVLNRVCVIKGQEVNVSTSVGISIYPNDGENIDMLLRNADTAMYRAKERGRNNYVSYGKHMNILAIERLQLEVNLRHAVERNELIVHYQPVADLISDQIIGAEALLRWSHPIYGHVPPTKFIPIAEETGLIQMVGNWVFKAVCQQLRLWLNDNIAVVPIAVNISAKQLQNKYFYDDTLKILREYNISPSLIVFELTESTVMADDDESTSILPQFQALGIRIAIDDFGTGYSSFSRLHKFPVDILKIDQSFTRRIDDANSSASVIKAIINMAKALKIRVVAEGVETEQQCEFLRINECDAVQGYYVSKSLTVQDFADQMQKQVHHGQVVSTSKLRTQPVSIINGNGSIATYEKGLAELAAFIPAI